jgi:hypothetical protein
LGSLAPSAIARAAPAAAESPLAAIVADSALDYSATATVDFIDAILMIVASMVATAIVKVR